MSRKSKQPDKVILFGAGGVGKSHSIASVLINPPEDRRLIYVMTERNAAGGLDRGLEHFKVDVKPGQIIFVFPKKKTKAFVDLNRAVSAFTKESKISALKGKADTTQGKENYTYLQDILRSFTNFTGEDYVTGEEVNLGNVGNLGKNDILIVDGLSPIGHEVWKTTVGDKIAISKTDFNAPQALMLTIFSELSVLDCPVILLAHEKTLTDEDGKVLKVVVNTCVGNANYETLMGNFTDVIHAYQFGTQYKWEGQKSGVHTISRKIPKESNLEPNFSKYGFFN